MNSVATMIAKFTPSRRPISHVLLFPQVKKNPMRPGAATQCFMAIRNAHCNRDRKRNRPGKLYST